MDSRQRARAIIKEMKSLGRAANADWLETHLLAHWRMDPVRIRLREEIARLNGRGDELSKIVLMVLKRVLGEG